MWPGRTQAVPAWSLIQSDKTDLIIDICANPCYTDLRSGAPPVPLALPASPRPSPPVSMCGAGGGLCFAWRGQPPASACPPHGCPESPRLGVGGGFRVPRMRTACAASGGCPRLIGWAKIAGHSVPVSTKFSGGSARRRFWLTVRFLSTHPRNCLPRTQQNQACCCVRLPLCVFSLH